MARSHVVRSLLSVALAFHVLSIAAEAKAAGTSSMSCPRCDGTLKTNNFEGVDIDTCDKCGGVWLDSGELEQLTKHESGWFARLLHRHSG